jgi:hypothetical protein
MGGVTIRSRFNSVVAHISAGSIGQWESAFSPARSLHPPQPQPRTVGQDQFALLDPHPAIRIVADQQIAIQVCIVHQRRKVRRGRFTR